MHKILTTLAVAAALCGPSIAAASAGTAPPSPPATAATAPTPGTASSTGHMDAKPVTLEPIVVTAANTEPHIWTFQKGDSKILVLGTIYPEPKGLDFIPFSINHAIAKSGAVIGAPWFNFNVHVSLFHAFHLLKLWRESKDVTHLPEGKHLADVVPPELMQRWLPLKAAYLPNDSKVDGMLPMYAGWKLYDAVLDRSGVAVKASIPKLIAQEAKKHGTKVTDASFHWTIQDPTKAAKEFTPDKEASLACFKSILDGIQGLPDASRTLASAWARGDVDTMRTYLHDHHLTPPCWEHLTDKALAKEQGIDLAAHERGAWLAAVNTAAAAHPVIFTTASVQEIYNHTGRIAWLLAEGYTEVTATPSAPASVGVTK